MRIEIAPDELILLIEGLERLKDETIDFGIRMAETPDEREANVKTLTEIRILEKKLEEKRDGKTDRVTKDGSS